MTIARKEDRGTLLIYFNSGGRLVIDSAILRCLWHALRDLNASVQETHAQARIAEIHTRVCYNKYTSVYQCWQDYTEEN